jgi:hypothetical protein
MLTFESDAPSAFFAECLSFKVKKNTLIIFPSTLIHHVNNTKSKNTRISLAFNTFVKGNFGANEKLDELILT